MRFHAPGGGPAATVMSMTVMGIWTYCRLSVLVIPWNGESRKARFLTFLNTVGLDVHWLVGNGLASVGGLYVQVGITCRT